MLYIAYFSFDEIGPAQDIRHGYFSSVVNTDSIEHAASEFKELVLQMKKTEKSFRNIVAVYIEDIFEFNHIPTKAIVTRIQSSAGEFPKSISHTLPGTVAPGINIYGFEPDVKANEGGSNPNEYKDSRIFIKF